MAFFANDRQDRDVDRALAAVERSGFRMMLLGRNIGLVLLSAWLGFGFALRGVYDGLLVVLGLLGLGLAVLLTLGTPYERRWHRYGLVGADVAALAIAAMTLPLLAGADVPRIFIFRAYGIHYLFFLIAVSTLALMPMLVLFTGVAVTAALWVVVIVSVRGMERVTSWRDLPPDARPEDYMALLLDPSFLGFGNRVEESVTLLLSAGLLAFAVHRARNMVRAHAHAARARRRAEVLFGRFVPTEIAQELLRTPGALQPRTSEASVLHLDIENFAGFAEGRAPDRVLASLNRFLEAAADQVTRHGGVAIGYAGDALLATFGMPRAHKDHARAAMAAALALLRMAETEAFEGERFRIRIGVASGPIAAGSVGGSAHQSYTVYGDVVNLAQRLEEKNKEIGSRLLISEDTWERAGRPAGLDKVDEIAVKGRTGFMSAYKL